MNPSNIVRKMFPTARRLLVEQSLKSEDYSLYRRVLIVGSGYDPYRDLFGLVDTYVCLDIEGYKNATDVIGDAHRLPFSGESFDCILCSEVMEHLHHPEWFVTEVERVLVEGGSMIASVPFMYHKHADPFDYWRPTDSALRNIMQTFSELRIRSQGNRIHTISDLITTIKIKKLPILFPLRILNYLLVLGTVVGNNRNCTSSAPSGYFVVAKK